MAKSTKNQSLNKSIVSFKQKAIYSQSKINETHEKLREILRDYNNPEWGDCIIDEICELFEFPTTPEE